MCVGGGNNRHHEEEAKRRQWAADRAAEEQRQRIAEQERQMQAAVADQQAEMVRLQALQAEAETKQRQTVDALRVQESEQLAQLQAQQAQQNAEILKMRDATSTVSASLRVLANAPQTKAPTAQQTRIASAPAARTTSPTSQLRIGSSGRGSGVGVNLGG